MTVTFWLLLAVVVYVYAGYPLVLVLARRVRGTQVVEQDAEERLVTLLVSAYNEEDVIAAKLRNSLALDYPRERLQIIVISDASDDGTDRVVQGFASDGVELLRMPERGGKTAGLNEAISRATGEIVVFSDANAMYARDAVRKLVRNFASEEVGAVVGESTYTGAEVESERSEGLYWRYETAIKRLESETGSLVGGDGAIYAIRRRLYVPMRADALSDFLNPLQIVRHGYRCVYEPEARSYERAADDYDKEFRRKVRIVNRAWRATFGAKDLLNPLRFGFFAIQLISHKLLRWLVPVFLLALFIANAWLLDQGGIYRVTMVAQLAFYVLATLGYAARSRQTLPAMLSIPYYFCLVNLASALGIIDAFRGKTYTTWTTARARTQ